MNNCVLVLVAIFLIGSTFTSCQKAESDIKPAVVTTADKPTDTPAEPVEEPFKELVLPGCEELNQLWKTRYHKKLKALWPLQDIHCEGPSRDRVFAEAAYILENTKFKLENLPEGVQPPPKDMLSFVTDSYNLLMIGLKDDPETDLVTKIITFYPAVKTEDGFSVIGNLIHEARHASGGAPTHHVVCTEGVNKDSSVCDNSLEYTFEKGNSHSVALLYFAWASSPRSNWPEERKQPIKEFTQSMVESRINATPEAKQAWIDVFLKAL